MCSNHCHRAPSREYMSRGTFVHSIVGDRSRVFATVVEVSCREASGSCFILFEEYSSTGTSFHSVLDEESFTSTSVCEYSLLSLSKELSVYASELDGHTDTFPVAVGTSAGLAAKNKT